MIRYQGLQQAILNEIGMGISKIGVTSWGAVQETCFTTRKRNTLGLTHGDDFVVTGSKGSFFGAEEAAGECGPKQKRTSLV